jgi:hypothetical protein
VRLNAFPVEEGFSMRHSASALAGALALALGCGDGGTEPGPDSGDGARLAAQFERLADSVDQGGWSPTAEALRHAATVVRLAGGATPVTVFIDGNARSFLAVAEQIDYPNLRCEWPGDGGVVPPDSGGTGSMPAIGGDPGDCTVVDTFSVRTFVAWEPERMAEVVRLVGDVGAAEVKPTVPDVMVGLPSTVTVPGGGSPDSSVSSGGGGGGGYPGFMGEYLVRDVGSWWAVEGDQQNTLESGTGSCTEARVTFDWADFACTAARFSLAFNMRVEPLRYEPLAQWSEGGRPPPAGGAEGSHNIGMRTANVPGVRLTVVGWTPVSLPPVPSEPAELDSSSASP